MRTHCKLKRFTSRFLALSLASVAMPREARAAEPAAGTKGRPNIIVILADDMGFSDLGCYGSEIRTPNLDGLAKDGLRFTQFYNVGRCCPTRACLLTGLYPHQAGVGHMVEDKGLPGYRGELNDRCVTMAQVLKAGGYGTYAVGKWHVANSRNIRPDGDKNAWPRQRGFDRYYGTITGAGSYYDPGSLTRDNMMISPLADPEYKPKRFYYTDAIADQAIRFINEHHQATPEKPLFMYTAFTCAHWPMHAPEEEVAKYKGRYDQGYEPIRKARVERLKQMGMIDPKWDVSPMVGDWEKMGDKAWEARCMEVYAAMIDRMDQNIGRMVQTLRDDGMLENTLILFLQDNGGCQEPIGRGAKATVARTFPTIAPETVRVEGTPKQVRDGRAVRQGVGVMPGPEDTFIAYGENWANVSNTPFRLYKHFVHEGGISTPLIAHWPAGIGRKGELEGQMGHLIDVMATCVDVSGAEYPKEFNGKAIQPMEGKSLVPAYWEHEGNRAMREGKWKLVARSWQGKWELYDMDADRTEMHDVATAEPERLKEMVGKWEAWAKRANVVPYPGEGKKLQADAKRSLVLKVGDDLKGAGAPDVAERSLEISVEVLEGGKDGVLVAQGGRAVGFAVYVKDGRPAFVVRRDGPMTMIQGKEVMPGGAVVKASLGVDGMMKLEVDGKEAASGRAAGALVRNPVEGIQVGRDEGAPVGSYTAPFAFGGKVGKVSLEMGERK
jgi:arylsulfatase A-like enzyme